MKKIETTKADNTFYYTDKGYVCYNDSIYSSVGHIINSICSNNIDKFNEQKKAIETNDYKDIFNSKFIKDVINNKSSGGTE